MSGRVGEGGEGHGGMRASGERIWCRGRGARVGYSGARIRIGCDQRAPADHSHSGSQLQVILESWRHFFLVFFIEKKNSDRSYVQDRF